MKKFNTTWRLWETPFSFKFLTKNVGGETSGKAFHYFEKNFGFCSKIPKFSMLMFCLIMHPLLRDIRLFLKVLQLGIVMQKLLIAHYSS